MAVTFAVSDVPTGTVRLETRPCDSLHEGTIACAPAKVVKGPRPGLVAAAELAFQHHLPLVLSPDHVWISIAQAFARHVSLNAEKLRRRLVDHEGALLLEVRRDDFHPDRKDNPWPEAIAAFSDEIARHSPRARKLVVCDFSTTTEAARTASEIVLMDVMKEFFRYQLGSLCGIPRITLEGTVDDWRSIRARADALGAFELEDWIKPLLRVLDEFVAAAEGRADREFWKSFYNLNDDSGGPFMTGWINVFYPYIGNTQANAFVDWNKWAAFDWSELQRMPEEERFMIGTKPRILPPSVCKVPFTWRVGPPGQTVDYPMELLAGLFGAVQDEDGPTVRPAAGWAVRRI
jgi:hypothetical protein